MKYNYFCPNPQCPCKSLQVIEKPEADEGNAEVCLECEEPLVLKGYVPFGGFLRVQSSTPAQRQEILRQRSKEHYKKEIKERKHEMLKSAGLSETAPKK